MKFKYYLTDLNEGAITGTNDPKVAQAHADSEDNFVVEAETGMWLQSTPAGGEDNMHVEVQEQTIIVLE